MSGSMGRGKVWEHGGTIVNEFLSALHSADWVALHIFAEKHEQVVPFTRDTQLIRDRIGALERPATPGAKQVRGYRTWIGDALVSVLAELQSEDRFGDTVVLVSDGEYMGYDKTKLAKSKRCLAAAGIRVFWFNAVAPVIPTLRARDLAGSSVGTYRRSDETYGWLTRRTEELVEETGGAIFDPWSAQIVVPGRRDFPLDSTFIRAGAREILLMIHRAFRVELEVTQPRGKVEKLTLELRDKRGRSIQDVYMFYPRYLLPQLQVP